MIPEKTYIINLPERTDRRATVTSEVERIGIPDYRFWRAVKDENGAKGLIESVRNLLTHTIAMDIQTALILEDDVVFKESWEVVEKAISQLPENWDMLYLGTNMVQQSVALVSDNLIRLTGGYATHAIIYSQKGMRKVLKMLEMFGDSPLDVQLVHMIQAEDNCYCTFPLVATQASGHSDIENKQVSYEQLIDQRFEKATRHLVK